MHVFPILKGVRPALEGSIRGNPNQCGQGNQSVLSAGLPSPSVDIGAGGGVGSLGTAGEGSSDRVEGRSLKPLPSKGEDSRTPGPSISL